MEFHHCLGFSEGPSGGIGFGMGCVCVCVFPMIPAV